jgi:hypothetical protein
MKMNDPTITPFVGFGSIKFGMYEEDVVHRLGAPEEMEKPDEEGDIIYSYESIGIEILAFDIDEDFRLVSIELNSKSNAILWDTKIFDKSLEDIMEISSSFGYSLKLDEIIEDDDRNIYEELYVIEPLNLNFYFDRSKVLSEISLGIFINKNDEIEWPE